MEGSSMGGDATVNGMSDGKDMGADGRSEHQSVRGKAQDNVARASGEVMDLGKTTGQSPGQSGGESLIAVKMQLVDAKQMAEILSVPVSAIYEHTRKKTIPHVRFGKYCRFDPTEVIAHYKRSVDGKQQK